MLGDFFFGGRMMPVVVVVLGVVVGSGPAVCLGKGVGRRGGRRRLLGWRLLGFMIRFRSGS